MRRRDLNWGEIMVRDVMKQTVDVFGAGLWLLPFDIVIFYEPRSNNYGMRERCSNGA